MTTAFKQFLKKLGPGILFAGAAVGGSHLVQSTRAGALYGYQLLPLVLLINLLKYPFFELSQRYTINTGNNILQGYLNYHRILLNGYFVISFFSSFVTIAAVSFVAASLLSYSLHGLISTTLALVIVLSLSFLILFIGHFKLLNTCIKALMLILTIAVIAASIMTLTIQTEHTHANSPDLLTLSSFTFMLALMGWMPAPLDSCAWTSLWLQQKAKRQQMTINDAIVDLRFGYILTTVLAVLFLSLGVEVMHYSGETFSSNGIAFSEQLIDLFGDTLGRWSESLLCIAAFATMFSTTLTCLDAYPRTLAETIHLQSNNKVLKPVFYWSFAIILCLCSFIIVEYYRQNLKHLIDLATILAFLTAPIIALFTLIVIKRTHNHNIEPSRPILILSYLGLIFLTLTTTSYLLLNGHPFL